MNALHVCFCQPVRRVHSCHTNTRKRFAWKLACVDRQRQPWERQWTSFATLLAYLLTKCHRDRGLQTGCSSSTAQAEVWSGCWSSWWGHVFIRRVRTRRSGEALAEEDVAYVAALRPVVGERERSPRLWQRSGTGLTCARKDLGRVAKGQASSTAINIWMGKVRKSRRTWEKGGNKQSVARDGLCTTTLLRKPTSTSPVQTVFSAVHLTAMKTVWDKWALQSGSNKPVINTYDYSDFWPL